MNFDDAFKCLTGNAPFPWQQSLYHDHFSRGNVPQTCSLPTGLGKTSIVAIWLLALANHPDRVPRRLVYVVNRRTVVDQTTTEVEKYRKALTSDPAVVAVRIQLEQLCAMPLTVNDGKEVPPLALSTLRGEFADNREWSADPTRPAVIVGTVDMIGSRLLFSGYGVGFKSKPLHAGFLGQDALLVHDEAHLEPAFQELLQSIEKEQCRCKESGALHIVELSATSRSNTKPFELTKQEKQPPAVIPTPPKLPIHVVWRRQTARKKVYLHPEESPSKLGEQIAKLALKFADSMRAVLVFVRKVEDVEKVVAKLQAAKQRTQQLTGTLRGFERDGLVVDPTFGRFLPDAVSDGETVFLVCTSAGEVGVNISADHLVCDLSTFDSMAQRFGRVNRFGNRDDTEIHVVYPNEFDPIDELEQRRARTLNLLNALGGDGSPKALGELDGQQRQNAFAPIPSILPTSDILFDAWALTTIRDKLPGRPLVEPYLHGISAWEPAETHVAWREEVWLLRLSFDSDEERDKLQKSERNRLGKLAAELLEDYPLKPHELLRDRSDRVFKHLAAIAERHPHFPVWLLEDDGTVIVCNMVELASKDRKERINNCTILLPPNAGGLLIENSKSRGMLVGTAKYEAECESRYDVADEWRDEFGPRRLRIWNDSVAPSGMRRIRAVAPPSTDDEDDDVRMWYWYERLNSGDGDGSKENKLSVAWQVHTDDVTTNAERIVALLPLSDELKTAVVVAAKFHDLGKMRTLWQRSIGNLAPTTWLAKSGGTMKRRDLGEAYRHEFGSLVDVLDSAQPYLADLNNLSEDMRDVVLHLIAAHHGFSRPHFPTEYVFDPEPKEVNTDHLAADIPQRFARLQRKYGRWRLAYLESLLRAADYAASANPSQFVEEVK